MQATIVSWHSVRWFTAIAMSVLLVACGGGGGGGGGNSGGSNAVANVSGSLDTTFGNNGVVTFNNTNLSFPSGRDDAGLAIVPDGNGRILITGYTINAGGYRSMGLWRYNANGTPDISFGADNNNDGITDGFTIYNGAAGGQSGDVGQAIAIDSLGRILVGGYGRNSTETIDNMVLWRYNSDGTLDTTFGSSGIVVQRNTAGAVGRDVASGVTVDSIGRIVVVGYSYNLAGNADAIVWRFTSTGALDNTFGGDYDKNGIPDGFVKLDGAAFPNSFDFGAAVKLDANGRILLAGSSGDTLTNSDMVVWRLTSSGSLDTSFGGDYDSNGTPDGFVKRNGATGVNSYDGASAITLDTSDRIIIVGSSYTSSTGYDMVIWRYGVDGAIDTTFGGDYDSNGVNDGFVRYNRGGTDVGSSVALDTNGKILVTGYSNNGTSYNDVAVWRYDSNGTPDTNFGNGGVVIYDTPPTAGLDDDKGLGIALDSSGRILVTGASFIGGAAYQDMTIYRFNP